MTFHFDPAALVSDPVSRARMELGDTVQDQGILPNGSNFSDEEISFKLSEAGDFAAGMSGLCSMVSARWALKVDYKLGPISENYSQVSKAFAALAIQWREKSQDYKGATSTPFLPADGYAAYDPNGPQAIGGDTDPGSDYTQVYNLWH